MARLRVIILAAALMFSCGVPAKAQATAAQGNWVDWGSSVLMDVLDTVAIPFQQAWALAWNAIGSTEAEIAEQKTKFANKIRNEMEEFTKQVERTGFEVSIIGISPDIIPKIEMTLKVHEPVSEAVEAQLRTEFSNPGKFGVIERTILLGLLDLDETAAAMKVEGYTFSDVELELVAIFPEVTLNFEREQTASTERADPASNHETKDILSD